MTIRALFLLLALLLPHFAVAGEEPKPDDIIAVNL